MRHLCYTILYFLTIITGLNAQVHIDADHTNIIYWGRVDHTNAKAPAFEYSGVTIKAKFSGTSISAVLHDFASHEPTTTNYFYKIVDGGNPIKFEALAGRNTYVLASELENGIHTIELIKLTEATVGKTAFEGFILEDNQSLLITDELDSEIEFIGDSITCGYGNEASITSNPSTGFTSINENNYNAWGYLASRLLGMRYKTIAYSGRGMYRNNGGDTKGIIPEIYDRIFPDDENSPVWNHNASHPNIIVINLGTNDFALDPKTPLDENLYKSTYISFVEKLKSHHPDATIICVIGTMMSDFYPEEAKHWTRIKAYVQDIVSTLNTSGYSKVHYLDIAPQVAPYGEDWHPSTATHTKMANTLVEFVNSITTETTAFSYKISNWLDHKKAAVALTFDDFSNGHPSIVVPELKRRNMNATFYINPSLISNWNQVKTAYNNGNEIANHSKTHKNLTLLSATEKSKEIRDAKTILEQQIPNSKILTFAYPYGSVNDVVLDSVLKSEHIGARGVTPSSNNYTYNFVSKETDYFEIPTYITGTKTKLNDFKNEITNIIIGGGFLNYLYHSVNSPTVIDNSYDPVSEANLKAQLDALLEKNDDIWICTFSQAIQYHKEKKTAKLIEVSAPFENNNTWTHNLIDDLSDDLYFQPLTIQVKIPETIVDILKVEQGVNPLDFKIINGTHLQYNAIPDGGIITISVTKKSTSINKKL